MGTDTDRWLQKIVSLAKGLGEARLLFDGNGMKFEAIAAPY